MSRGLSRRDLMKKVLAAGALLPAFGTVAKGAQAERLTPLHTKDPAATALGFVTLASAASANPLYKKGQHCATCVHYLGTATEASAGCNIYAGRSVPANAWCIVWSQR